MKKYQEAKAQPSNNQIVKLALPPVRGEQGTLPKANLVKDIKENKCINDIYKPWNKPLKAAGMGAHMHRTAAFIVYSCRAVSLRRQFEKRFQAEMGEKPALRF